MTKIRSIAVSLLSLDTRSLEFSIAFLNFVWGWWLLFFNNQVQDPLVLTSLVTYGGSSVWGTIFMFLFACGFVLAYRSVVHHEVIFWNIRFYVLVFTSFLWLSFSVFFFIAGGVFSIPASVFFGVGIIALFGGNLLRWDHTH